MKLRIKYTNIVITGSVELQKNAPFVRLSIIFVLNKCFAENVIFLIIKIKYNV